MGYIDELGKNAKVASRSLVKLGTAEKNQILGQVADALLAETDYILAENARDVDQAQKNGISPVMVDRLRLDTKRIEGIVEGVPCHRVLGNQGQLTGYAGGVERKCWLLEHEKANF